MFGEGGWFSGHIIQSERKTLIKFVLCEMLHGNELIGYLVVERPLFSLSTIFAFENCSDNRAPLILNLFLYATMDAFLAWLSIL